MGREFLDVFTGWAKDYDKFVQGKDEEYQEVFAGYEEILDEIVDRSGDNVIEFGIGTGNLTRKLVDAGKAVFPIEPSAEMRKLAKEKLPNTLSIQDGDMQVYPKPDFPVNTIVSSYVFHHLTDDEKIEAMKGYADLLEEDGKVIFADTLFISQEAYDQIIEHAQVLEYDDLVEDLKREHYPVIDAIYTSLRQAGMTNISFKQMNEFVWLFEAQKA